MGTTDSLAALARPVLGSVGLELWDVEVTSSLVRFLVDRPGGVDLDAVASAGTVLTPLLDAHDELLPAGRFDLEVSSPGIERTLRTPEHFRRSTGALLTVKTRVPVDASGARRLRATLTGSDDTTVELLGEGAAEPIRVPLDDIERARVVFEWGPAAKGGTKGAAKGKAKADPKRPRPPKPAHQSSGSGSTPRPAANEKGSGS